ncbi:MAG: hypothetical protein ACYTFZ_02945 [Planctomycetota bacterium]|jgi:hypothetical protein
MNPLIIPLAKLGAMLGMNLIQMLQSQGVQFTDDELRAYRAESQRSKDEWDALAPEED